MTASPFRKPRGSIALTFVVAAVLGMSALLVTSASMPVRAGEVEVVDAKAEKTDEGIFKFTVTLKHADTGWDHYADRWEIVAPDGTVLGRRTLYHPHVDEQPFTRSLGNVRVPDGITEVTVRGHDSVHGLGGNELKIKLPAEKSS